MHPIVLAIPSLALLLAIGVVVYMGVCTVRREKRREAEEELPALPPCTVVCPTCPGRAEELAAIEGAKEYLGYRSSPAGIRRLAELDKARVASRMRHHWFFDHHSEWFACVHCPVKALFLPPGESADETIDRPSFEGRRTVILEWSVPNGGPRDVATATEKGRKAS